MSARACPPGGATSTYRISSGSGGRVPESRAKGKTKTKSRLSVPSHRGGDTLMLLPWSSVAYLAVSGEGASASLLG